MSGVVAIRSAPPRANPRVDSGFDGFEIDDCGTVSAKIDSLSPADTISTITTTTTIASQLTANVEIPHALPPSTATAPTDLFASKLDFVESLVDTAVRFIVMIWPQSYSPSPNCSTKLVPLRQFVSQLLERSRTSWTTLQLTLFYLLRIRNTKPKHLNTSPNAPPANPLSHCGRRMFLAALMVAQKWAQDKNYSAKAWSQITGLKCSDLCALERAFLERIDWKLFINAEKFTLWNRALVDIARRVKDEKAKASPAVTSPKPQSVTDELVPNGDTTEVTGKHMPAASTKPTMVCNATGGLSPLLADFDVAATGASDVVSVPPHTPPTTPTDSFAIVSKQSDEQDVKGWYPSPVCGSKRARTEAIKTVEVSKRRKPSA